MNEYETGEPGPSMRDRIARRTQRMSQAADRRADNMEARYLSILRYSLLIIATALVVFAIWSLGFGLVRQVGSTTVSPDRFRIDANQIAPAPITSGSPAADMAPAEDTFAISPALRKLTLQTYRAAFAPFERKGEDASADKVMTAVWPRERREAFDRLAANSLVEDNEGKPINSGEQLAIMSVLTASAAAGEPGLASSLRSYRQAKKVRVCEYKTRVRQRTISSWDSYSTSCDDWYNYPYGCPSTERVDEPYTAKVCEMRFPSDLESPPEALGNAVQRFAELADVEGERARNDALAKEGEIASRKLRGREGIMFAGQLFLGFLAVMLTYLLVALERHHRILSGLVGKRDATIPGQ